MMASEFVGLRLNYKKDEDILGAIDNARNRTKEIKRLLRLGIAASNGKVTTVAAQKPEPAKPINWGPSFENKEPVKPKKDSKNNITANILGGFDF